MQNYKVIFLEIHVLLKWLCVMMQVTAEKDILSVLNAWHFYDSKGGQRGIFNVWLILLCNQFWNCVWCSSNLRPLFSLKPSQTTKIFFNEMQYVFSIYRLRSGRMPSMCVLIENSPGVIDQWHIS